MMWDTASGVARTSSTPRVRCRHFLKSAANYWLTEYHFDGLRMDAISRIIYWMGDEARGVNDRAVEFIKGLNQGLEGETSFMYTLCRGFHGLQREPQRKSGMTDLDLTINGIWDG